MSAPTLTPRDTAWSPAAVELILCYAAGMHYQAILASLHLSEGGVKSRLRRLREITGANSIARLVALAVAAEAIHIRPDGTPAAGPAPHSEVAA